MIVKKGRKEHLFYFQNSDLNFKKAIEFRKLDPGNVKCLNSPK